jgi:hypothetical protein
MKIMRSILCCVALATASCGFSAAASDANQAEDSGTTSCPVACGNNEQCNATSRACECAKGFSGRAGACVDVNECNISGTCAGQQCVNLSGSFECYAPATCKEVKNKNSTAQDGEYILYYQGDSAKPWTAYCHDMNTAEPTEYLTLNPSENMGSYKEGGASPGTTVTTQYKKARINPSTLALNASDQTFVLSVGGLLHSTERTPVISMPLGVAMSCKGDNDQSATAKINLTGTRFFVSGSFAVGGNEANGSATESNNQQKYVIKGGGNCGFFTPSGFPFNPFNNNGGNIQLGYR